MKILHWSLTMLHSTSIGKIYMVSQCKSVVGLKVVVGLEILAFVSTHKLSLFHLIRTLRSKSLIIEAFFFSLVEGYNLSYSL